MKLDSQKKKQAELLLHKLLHDALFLWMLVFLAFLIAESLIPGYLTAHIGFGKLIAAFFALGLAAAYLGKCHNLNSKTVSIKDFLKSKIALLIIPVFILLIIISLRKFENIEIIVITSATAAIAYYLLKIFYEE